MISKNLKYRAKRAGLPPGTLPSTPEIKHSEIAISLIDYDANHLIEKKGATFKECPLHFKKETISWINVCGTTDPQTIITMGKHFGLHPLMLEDIMSVGQRSKLDNYKDTLYIVTQMLTYNDKTQSVENEQVSIILGKNYVISFLESKNNIFSPVSERLREPKGRLRQRGADYLCYALIDCLVDSYFLILEKVDMKMENLEEELIHFPEPKTLQKIQHCKREITLLRKSVWPMREVISNFRRLETPLIQDSTKVYIQDVYDHTIQAIDAIESFRDISSGMLDIYLSNMTQRMNEVIKVLTVVSTIFVPLTFIASLYGMNFVNIPEIHYKSGYYVVLSVMALITIGMIIYFKRKRWI